LFITGISSRERCRILLTFAARVVERAEAMDGKREIFDQSAWNLRSIQLQATATKHRQLSFILQQLGSTNDFL